MWCFSKFLINNSVWWFNFKCDFYARNRAFTQLWVSISTKFRSMNLKNVSIFNTTFNEWTQVWNFDVFLLNVYRNAVEITLCWLHILFSLFPFFPCWFWIHLQTKNGEQTSSNIQHNIWKQQLTIIALGCFYRDKEPNIWYLCAHRTLASTYTPRPWKQHRCLKGMRAIPNRIPKVEDANNLSETKAIILESLDK